jgi:hypothetical protein
MPWIKPNLALATEYKMRIRTATIRSILDRLTWWFRELETKADLKFENGRVRCTATFLKMLRTNLEEMFGFTLTLTETWSIWRIVLDAGEGLRAGAAELADLAFWYGMDPWKLTPTQRIALYNNLPRVKAQNTLESGNFSATDYRGVYNLVLLATGDEKAASKARADAMERYVNLKTNARE